MHPLNSQGDFWVMLREVRGQWREFFANLPANFRFEFSKELIEPIQKHMEKRLGFGAEIPNHRASDHFTIDCKWSSCYLQDWANWMTLEENIWKIKPFRRQLGYTWMNQKSSDSKYNFCLRSIKNLNETQLRTEKQILPLALVLLLSARIFPLLLG